MSGLLLFLLQLYLLVFLGRAVFSWFPPRTGGAAASVNRVLCSLTEPVWDRSGASSREPADSICRS